VTETPSDSAPHAQDASGISIFAHDGGAELFPARSRKAAHRGVRYKRFARASEAVRFAIEELPAEILAGTYLETDEMRFDHHGIRRLYASDDYPLARRTATAVRRSKYAAARDA
jgi:hypothetical protein